MPATPHRIAFCITDLDVGGAERCLVQIVRGLDRTQWQPYVFCLAPPGALADELTAAGIPVTCLHMRGIRHASRILSLASHLRRFRPNLLQTFLFHGNLAGRLAARLAGVPIVVSGIRVAEREHTWHVRLERWTRGLVTHQVCVSRAVADFSIREQRLAPNDVSVIPNGVDVERFAAARPLDLKPYGVPPGARVILSIGRLHHQKGHDLLIEAAAPVLQEHDDVHVVIIGEGPARTALQGLIDARQLTSRMHLVGRQPDVAPWLKSAALFVLASRWEGMPNVLLEAMAAACPVIATDVEGVRELLAPDVSGCIVPPENVAELTSAVHHLMTDPVRRHSLGQEAQCIASKTLTSMAAASEYARLYGELLRPPPD